MAAEELDDGDADLLVELRWNDYDTGLFADKLFRHVRRHEVEFDLEARQGSLATTFAVAVAGASTVKILSSIIRYLWNRRNDPSEEPRDIPSAVVLIVIGEQTHRVELDDEEDVMEAEDLLQTKMDQEQTNIDDF